MTWYDTTYEAVFRVPLIVAQVEALSSVDCGALPRDLFI